MFSCGVTSRAASNDESNDESNDALCVWRVPCGLYSWCLFQYRFNYQKTGSGDHFGIVLTQNYPSFPVLLLHYHHDGQHSVRASFAEIYNEQVYDLLNLQSGPLQVRWNVRNGFFVQGECSSCSVFSIFSPMLLFHLKYTKTKLNIITFFRRLDLSRFVRGGVRERGRCHGGGQRRPSQPAGREP